MLNSLLVYRFVVFNVLVFASLAIAGIAGHLIPLYTQDSSYITFLTSALYLASLVALTKRVVSTSRSINRLKGMSCGITQDPAEIAILRDKAVTKTKWFSDIPDYLVTLGLLGTIIGFAIILRGIESSSGGNPDVKSIIANMIAGLRVKINTTIVGVILALLFAINVRIFRTAHDNYWADRIKAGIEV